MVMSDDDIRAAIAARLKDGPDNFVALVGDVARSLPTKVQRVEWQVRCMLQRGQIKQDEQFNLTL